MSSPRPNSTTFAETGGGIVSLVMIVKDEENFVENALKDVYDIFDEVVIVDTGSTDRTQEICSRYTQSVYSKPFSESFAGARNYALSLCSRGWIFFLDADEVIERSEAIKIISYLRGQNPDKSLGFTMYRYNFFQNGGWYTSRELKIFTNSGSEFFKGDVGESVRQSILADGGEIREKDWILLHYGHTRSRQIRDAKARRYLALFGDSSKPINELSWKAAGTIALLKRSLGEYDEALTFANAAHRTADNAFTNYCLGQIWRYRNASRAIEFYRRSLEIADDVLVANLLSIAFVINKEYERGLDILTSRSEINPRLTHLKVNIAVIYALKNDRNRCVEQMKKVRAEGPAFLHYRPTDDYDPYRFEMFDTISSYDGLEKISHMSGGD
ncbi:tetratricopeptide repeat-containing glycosyltransferase family 2 protein [Rhizobium leguminosarum]|uniref:tetratricopeptide repeat-containing glycosyltransferase family 2 protein n=1 Tax=Rhizobium leguminosarum TaxID=384 RepID=UPI00041BE88B|nr:glycosyltransferase [Rhizobium leguminosarum]